MQSGMSNSYYNDLATVHNHLGVPEILAQIAEKASELSQAALKYRRVLDGTNPTPISGDEAYCNLYEELADILTAFDALEMPVELWEKTCPPICKKKAERWRSRIEETQDT